MSYNRKDYFFNKAKKEGFAARSIFKLEEIDKKFRLLKQGQKVLDLGCAPGSWSQYVSKKIGQQGRLLGVDLQAVKFNMPNSVFYQGDMLELQPEQLFQETGVTPPFDLVISDMAPKTTGVRITDQARSMELCELALSVAERFLKPKGHFVCKMFHSAEFEDFRKKLRGRFEKVEIVRPESTRKESKEIFFVCLSFQT
jgi:23S rRNA (uridine2552-2'-O)-methyltransferase